MNTKPYRIYHVFDWDNGNTDQFFDTYYEALSYYNKLGLSNYENRRLYEEVYDDLGSFESGVSPAEENLLKNDENWEDD